MKLSLLNILDLVDLFYLLRKYPWLIVLVFYTTINNSLVISRRVLGKLPVLLVHLFWHKPVSRDANPKPYEPRKAAISSINEV